METNKNRISEIYNSFCKRNSIFRKEVFDFADQGKKAENIYAKKLSNLNPVMIVTKSIIWLLELQGTGTQTKEILKRRTVDDSVKLLNIHEIDWLDDELFDSEVEKFGCKKTISSFEPKTEYTTVDMVQAKSPARTIDKWFRRQNYPGWRPFYFQQ